MPINVTCPGCFTKFTVADKFAGQKGPCKKCKTLIEIPKLEDQIVIHAPEHSEAGAVGTGGRHALKTYKRQDTKFQPLVFAVVIGVVLVMLLVALVLRGQAEKPTWLLALAAVVLGPVVAWAGYTFLRDDELEGYTGTNLWLRSLACGARLCAPVGSIHLPRRPVVRRRRIRQRPRNLADAGAVRARSWPWAP